MIDFEEKILERMRSLEREVERLRVKERPVGGGGVTDHGALTGLADDDHTQYLNNTRHDTTARHTLGTVVPHDDHGLLSGLADNDHPQYLLTTGKAADSDKLDGLDSTGFLLDNGWQSYTPTWTAATTNPAIGNGTLSGRYVQIGKLVYCQFTMIAGSTTTFGSGIWRFSYPVAPNQTSVYLYQVGSVYANDVGASVYTGVTQYGGETYMILNLGGNWASATSPFTWSAANGDALEVNVIYEAA